MAVFPIDAPPPEPGQLGLLAVAEEVNMSERWEQDGIGFVPEPCSIPAPLPLDCVPSADIDESVYDAPNYESVVNWRPFLTIGQDNCGYLRQADQREAAVRRHLEWTESHQAEQEFMFLAATGGTAKENPGLFSAEGATALVPATTAPKAVVGAVDGALYTALGGQEGILHISPTLAAVVADEFKMTDDGFYRTRLGNRVAIGSGYQFGTGIYDFDGSDGGPTVNGNVVFGTPMVYFSRGDIVVHGLDNNQANYRENTTNIWAERPIILWSSRCAVIGSFADLSVANINDDDIDGGGA